MGNVMNILLVGVGGQGILLASELLSEVLMAAGHDVKKSEIHGMSQRGGSVVSHVRFGERVHSPVIPEGEGDLLLGFELLETYRFLPLITPAARVVANDFTIPPPSVLLGKEPYPDDLHGRIRQRHPDSLFIDADRLAGEAGDPRTANTVLLGAVSSLLPIEEPVWHAALERFLPEKIRSVNTRAFFLGRSRCQEP